MRTLYKQPRCQRCCSNGTRKFIWRQCIKQAKFDNETHCRIHSNEYLANKNPQPIFVQQTLIGAQHDFPSNQYHNCR